MSFDKPTREEVEAVCRKFDDEATMKIAKLYVIEQCGLYGKAHRYLMHYLEGTGERVVFSLRQLLGDVWVLSAKIEAQIRAEVLLGHQHGSFNIHQSDYEAVGKEAKDWQYALGAFRVHWRTVGGASNCFLLTVINEYLWHPETMGGKRTECVHEAGARLNRSGKAKNFTMMGSAEIEFDPRAPIRLQDANFRVQDAL